MRIGDSPARPANIEVARKRTVTVVRDEVGLVFPRNILSIRRFVGLLGSGNVFGLPSHAPVERAANVNSVARGVVAPVAVGAELVEGDVADESVALIVVSCRNIARDAIVRRLDARGDLPSAASIEGIRGVRVVLIDRDELLRSIRIDGDAGLGEVSGLRSESDDVGVGSFGWKLRGND